VLQVCGGEEVMFEIARGASAQTKVVIQNWRGNLEPLAAHDNSTARTLRVD
jgi:hypothetical protein